MKKTMLKADWISFMNAYRLYEPEHPQYTVAYEDDEDEAVDNAIENGYDGIDFTEGGKER